MLNDLDFQVLKLFALNVRKYRLKNKLSQAQLAFEVGLSLRQLQRIEKAEFKTNILVLYKLTEAFDIKMDDFFKEEL